MSQVSRILRNGQWTAARSRDTRFIRNPATLELVGTVPECNADDVDAAVDAAATAQYGWWKTPGVEKAKLLREVGARIRKKERELATLMTRETGKPRDVCRRRLFEADLSVNAIVA